VRHDVTLGDSDSSGAVALLFELSQAGCRVSNFGERRFLPDESVRIHVPGFGSLEGRVRLAGEGAIALRYAQPLHSTALHRLLSVCRGLDLNKAVA